MEPGFCCMLLVALAGLAHAAESSLSDTQAREVFAEEQRLCRADHGRLWQIDLCAPLLLIDPATREVVASQNSPSLSPRNGVYVGRLPNAINAANTALDWDGTRWVALLWPLPNDRATRATMLMHESWHRVQTRLGLPAADPIAAHLDTRDGRTRLRLEWRALAAALKAKTATEQRAAIADALAFRAWRRELAPDAAANESALELNEGLAEYTGRKLGGGPDATAALAADLLRAEHGDSFVRSFAYATGPAYGMLLDRYAGDWRHRVKVGDDLATLLAQSADIAGMATPNAIQRSERYNASVIVAEEAERERAHLAQLAAFRAELVEGPVLVLPLIKMSIQFNPSNLLTLPGAGTVYPTLRLSDRWGVLEVSAGALIDAAWKRVHIAAPKDPQAHPLTGKGWKLDLASGWALVPGARQGDWSLKQSDAP